MRTDLVLSPFGTRGRRGARRGAAADAGGFEVLWTYDHFGGAVVGAPWSRHPFVTLGAVAAVTERIGLGVLVANASNRHPAQLASAINTLQSLAPGRVCCGVGSGTAATSPFAVEQHAIGRTPAPAVVRREHLRETIACLRAIWQNQPTTAPGCAPTLRSPWSTARRSPRSSSAAGARRSFASPRRSPTASTSSTARSSARSSAWPAS